MAEVFRKCGFIFVTYFPSNVIYLDVILALFSYSLAAHFYQCKAYVFFSSVFNFFSVKQIPEMLNTKCNFLTSHLDMVFILLDADVSKGGFHLSLTVYWKLWNHSRRDCLVGATENKACEVLSTITLQKRQ